MDVMNKFKFLLIPTLMLALAGCAPAATGSQVSIPVVASSALSPVSLMPGQTVYVQYTYPNSLIDVPDARFDALKINFDARENNNEVLSPEAPAVWLNIKVSGLPAGWNVTLAQAYLVKQIGRTRNDSSGTEVRFSDQVRAIYKITAPLDAASVESATVSFYDGTAALGDVLMLMSVKK